MDGGDGVWWSVGCFVVVVVVMQERRSGEAHVRTRAPTQWRRDKIPVPLCGAGIRH